MDTLINKPKPVAYMDTTCIPTARKSLHACHDHIISAIHSTRVGHIQCHSRYHLRFFSMGGMFVLNFSTCMQLHLKSCRRYSGFPYDVLYFLHTLKMCICWQRDYASGMGTESSRPKKTHQVDLMVGGNQPRVWPRETLSKTTIMRSKKVTLQSFNILPSVIRP